MPKCQVWHRLPARSKRSEVPFETGFTHAPSLIARYSLYGAKHGTSEVQKISLHMGEFLPMVAI